mmetsp:Transcript_47516/g.85505  ORF Transcript_47516/g.85505 Transcript_47516/m.85505 type:complete len:248 (-) Transcript_47516:602-1345(-)
MTRLALTSHPGVRGRRTGLCLRGLRLLQRIGGIVDLLKLPFKVNWVQERPQVEAVVLWAIVFCVVGRSERCHLVPLRSVIEVKVLHLLRHPPCEGLRLVIRGLSLGWRQLLPGLGPGVLEPEEHPQRSTLLHLADVAKITKFCIGHAHVLFIQLRTLRARELSGRLGLCSGLQNAVALVLAGPQQEGLQVSLSNPSDRIDVGSTTVVLRVITSQRLIDICTAQHQQCPWPLRASFVGSPGHELSKII